MIIKKLTNTSFAAFTSKVKAFLVFGPDEGAVREIFLEVSQAIVPDITDAFRVVNISSGTIKSNQSILFDEAASLSLMGGRRLIRVDAADENVVEPLTLFLEKYEGDSFVVLNAGNLAKTSKLRILEERDERMACYVAYPDDECTLREIITADLKKAGKTADSAAVSWLIANMGADRAITRSEIQKLIVFAGDKTKITLEIAQEVVGDGSAASKDDLVFALASGDFPKMDKLFTRIFKEDENAAVSVIRTAIYHFQKLHLTLARIENGMNSDAALKAIYPNLFYKKADEFKAQLRLWNRINIEKVLRYLVDTEIACKSTGNVPEIICANAFLNICRLTKHVMAR